MAGTFTYRPDKLSEQTAIGSLMRVRLTLSDTDVDAQLFADEELIYFASIRATEYGACAEAARALAARFSSKVNSSIGDLRADFSQKQSQWAQRAREFEGFAAMNGGAIPYMGGISKTDMDTQRQNTDRVPPQFSIGMNDSNIPQGAPGPQEGGPGTAEGGNGEGNTL